MIHPPIRPIILVDGPAELQAWIDAVTDLAAVTTTGAFSDGPHDDPPHTVVTAARVWDVVNRNFLTEDGAPWSVATMGLPPIPAASEPGPEPPPNKGSDFHNALHALLGNFH